MNQKSIEDFKKEMEIINDLQSKINDGIDPNNLIESLGISSEELESYFLSSTETKIKLNYTNNSNNEDPRYAYESDSGFDLRSTEEVWVQANSRVLVPTGLKFDILLLKE